MKKKKRRQIIKEHSILYENSPYKDKGMDFRIKSLAEGGDGQIKLYGLWKNKATHLPFMPWQYQKLRTYIDRGYYLAMQNPDQLYFQTGDEEKEFKNYYYQLNKHRKLNII